MIYGECLTEQENYYNKDSFILNLITESINTTVEFCLSELEILDEVNISDEYKQAPKQKTKFEILKEMVAKLWKSFKEWCAVQKKKILDLITKVKSRFNKGKTSQSSSSDKTDDGTDKKEEKKKEEPKPEPGKIRVLVLNDKFNKIDESKLLSNQILDLSASLTNYDKNLFENYNNAAYTQKLVTDITSGEFSSIDDIKGKVLVEEKEMTASEATNTAELTALSKKYDSMISEVDNYFNKLQDSIRKAEAKFKGQMLPTSYSDDNVNATTTNPLQTRQMQFILKTSVQMIGAQSGIVRNIVYAKVDAINRVLESRIIV